MQVPLHLPPLAAAYPGTILYRQASENGWLRKGPDSLVTGDGVQISSLEYPHLSYREIFEALATFCRRFYFRPRKIGQIIWEMAKNREMTKRGLQEGTEFLRFLNARETGT